MVSPPATLEINKLSDDQLIAFVKEPSFSRAAEVDAARAELATRGLKVPTLPVGGWLIFFCILIVIIGPMRNYENQGPAYSIDPSGHAHVIDQPYSLAQDVLLIFEIATGIYVWNRLKYSLWLLRIFFVAMLGWAIFSAFVQIAPVADSIAEILGIVLWWFYFRFSKRVRWTLGANI